MSLLKDKIEIEIAEAEIGIQKKLSTFSPFFRWVIIILIFAIIPAYWVTKKIALRFWQKQFSQNKFYAKPSFENPGDLKIQNSFLVPVGANNYFALVEIVNPNLDLAIKEISYHYKFFNSQNEEIIPQNGKIFDKTFILPNQKKYLVSERIFEPKNISKFSLELTKDVVWQKMFNLPKIKLLTPTPKFYHSLDPIAFTVEGVIENQSAYHLKQVNLTFLVYDQNRNLVTVSEREEYDLSPFERRAYKQLWPRVLVEQAGNVLVQADTNTTDPNNIKIEIIGDNNAADLSRPENKENYK